MQERLLCLVRPFYSRRKPCARIPALRRHPACGASPCCLNRTRFRDLPRTDGSPRAPEGGPLFQPSERRRTDRRNAIRPGPAPRLQA